MIKLRIPMPSLLTLFCTVILALPCCPAWGWYGTGHKIVAFIAWEDLTPKTKAAVTAILKQHPRYQEDLMLDAPANETPDEQARTAFATAATWPDLVRSLNNPMNHTHSHPSWHYIDIPYSVGGEPVPAKSNAGPGPHDAIEALTQCVAEVKNPGTSGPDRAVDLCWIEHLIGDIHQPLHAVSLYSKEFPNGDQGGNAEVVLKTPPYPDSSTKLHALWDGLPGDFESEEMARFEGEGLRADPNYSREKMKDLLASKDFMAWAKESHDLAIEDAYLNGNLKTAPAHRGGWGGSAPGVPPGYVEKAEHVAMHQLALAGYRLADVLNGIFDPK